MSTQEYPAPYRRFEPFREGFVALDVDGRVLYANPAAARMLQRPPAELVGRFLWDLPELRGSALESELRATHAAVQPRTFRAYYAPGRTWLELRAEPADRELCLYVQDVAASRPIAEAVENIEQAFILLDRAGNYVYVNRAAARMAGQTQEALIGQNAWEQYPRTHASPIYAAVGQVFATRQAVHLEMRAPTIGRELEMSFYPQGEYVSVFARDITERKAAQRRLEASEQEFRSLFELSAVGNAQVDLRTRRFVRVNETFCQITGYRPEELYERTAADITFPDDREEDNRRHLAARQGPDSHWSSEKRYVHKEGHAVWVQVEGTIIRDADGHPLYSQAAVLDISEHKRLNERLRGSIRETHHRVKNNLQVIAALIDMQAIEHEVLVPIGQIDRLRQHIQALASLHDLLTDQARDDTDVYGVSVDALLRKLLPLLRAMAEGRRITCSVQDALLPVRQATTVAVLLNELISNALKHGAGEIRVTFAHGDDRSATLEVDDQGPGFPTDFVPAHAAHTGMDLVQSLARFDLGASVEYSTRPEGGGRVRLRFPLRAPVRTPGEE